MNTSNHRKHRLGLGRYKENGMDNFLLQEKLNTMDNVIIIFKTFMLFISLGTAIYSSKSINKRF